MGRCTWFGLAAAVFGLAAGCATPAPPPSPDTGATAQLPKAFQNRWQAPSAPAQVSSGTRTPTGPAVAAVPFLPAVAPAPAPPPGGPVRPPQVVMDRSAPITPAGGPASAGDVSPAAFTSRSQLPPAGDNAPVWKAVAASDP